MTSQLYKLNHLEHVNAGLALEEVSYLQVAF